jgi:uncharacterized membrane protein (DUF2068 family)
MTTETNPSVHKKKAAGLYSIAVFKLGKGIVFLLVTWGIYALSDENLPQMLRDMLTAIRLNPEHQFFQGAFQKLAKITESNMLWVAGGTLAYACLAMVEGIGLFLRYFWAAYLAIAESAIFIPVEIYELSKTFTYGMLFLLGLNIFILVYLWRNRHRLFRHLHEHVPEG